MTDTPNRCECPELAAGGLPASAYAPEELKARHHEPNECPGDYGVALYERSGTRLWLCSCCNLFGDRLVQPAATAEESTR